MSSGNLSTRYVCAEQNNVAARIKGTANTPYLIAKFASAGTNSGPRVDGCIPLKSHPICAGWDIEFGSRIHQSISPDRIINRTSAVNSQEPKRRMNSMCQKSYDELPHCNPSTMSTSSSAATGSSEQGRLAICPRCYMSGQTARFRVSIGFTSS